jgi:agmatinase
MTFDPNAAAAPGSGIFGLPFTRLGARIIVHPIPFDATTSFGHGTHAGPDAVIEASAQVDLLDHHFGRVYEQGIFAETAPKSLQALSKEARKLAAPIIAKGGAAAKDAKAVRAVESAGERVNDAVRERFERTLAECKVPALLGGDHSTPLGAIAACADFAHSRDRKGGLGILHVDAHMDMRDAFEGFRYSHASIMFNAMSTLPRVTRLVQVGIRDYGEGELQAAREHGRRMAVHFDADWAAALLEGRPFSSLCAQALKPLPENVYVSFDIDGLDPSLCPNTGTPVPGGLSFAQAALLLKALRDSGRTVVGFDLVEVAPSPTRNAPPWDATVGARVLYKLCGCATPK